MGKKRQRSSQRSSGTGAHKTPRSFLATTRRERDEANPFRRVRDQWAAYKAGKRVKESFLIENRLQPRHKDNVGFKAERETNPRITL